MSMNVKISSLPCPNYQTLNHKVSLVFSHYRSFCLHRNLLRMREKNFAFLRPLKNSLFRVAAAAAAAAALLSWHSRWRQQQLKVSLLLFLLRKTPKLSSGSPRQLASEKNNRSSLGDDSLERAA